MKKDPLSENIIYLRECSWSCYTFFLLTFPFIQTIFFHLQKPFSTIIYSHFLLFTPILLLYRVTYIIILYNLFSHYPVCHQ